MTEAPRTTPPMPIVLDDRLCDRCGFNLNGRHIEREEQYGLHIATCPQCGQVAAIESYPRLGPWAGRWAMLAAALWLFLLTVVGLGGIGFTTGTTIGILIETTEILERQIRNDYSGWFNRTYPDAPARSQWDEGRFQEFWEQESWKIKTSPARTGRSIEYEETPLFLFPIGGSFVFGVFWSLATLAARRWPIALIAVAVAGLYTLGVGIAWITLANTPPGSAHHVAWLHQRIGMLMVLLPFMVCIFLAGLAAGRAITRGIVRAFMPPRFRGALALLWTSAGKPVPWPREHR